MGWCHHIDQGVKWGLFLCDRIPPHSQMKAGDRHGETGTYVPCAAHIWWGSHSTAQSGQVPALANVHS